jgi:hypothetical protein
MTEHIGDRDKCLVLLELQREMLGLACEEKDNAYQKALRLVSQKIERLNRNKLAA